MIRKSDGTATRDDGRDRRRRWEIDRDLSCEEQEREFREEKIRELLAGREDTELGKAYDARLVRRLAEYARPFWREMVLAVVLMGVSSLLSVAAPWIIGRAIDDGIRAASMQSLRVWSGIFGAAAVGEWLTNRTRIATMAYVGTRVVADLRSALFRHLLGLSLGFYNRYSVGRLMSRLSSDVGVLQHFITWSITGLARGTLMLVGIVVAMLSLNWRLALVTFTVLPPMAYVTYRWRGGVRRAYRATRQRLSLINGYLNESISGIRVTKSFVREGTNLCHFDDLNLSHFDAQVDATRLSALFFPGVGLMGALARGLVVAVGGWLVFGETLTAGTLVAFVLYVGRFFQPILDLARRYSNFQATMAASERIFDLLDREPELEDAPDAVVLPPVKGHVMFDHVSFEYEDGEAVLKDISLEAKPGERIALVGETGSGKTTVIRLMARFFETDQGRVSIDGYDVRQVTKESLRSQLGVVLQDSFLFSGSIMENIRYGRLDAEDEEVIEAAKAVGAHEFITALPDGYKTEVGEEGVTLSVGQRQIVSFARTLLGDPRVLIMDEATSSVDTTTENQIQRAVDRLMDGRTSVIIAHRLNTVVSADKIIVLDEGKIVEQGTHEGLLAKRGRYYDLYSMQWAGSDGAPKTVSG
jgi:ATP-binding cassette subfamily B protein/subfamily B ATP-binding cassette protein MsbA